MLANTVTHEMMTPLNCVDTFTRCIRQADDFDMICYYCDLVCHTTAMLKFNMRSMLDSNLIKKGIFQPIFKDASIFLAIDEIVNMLKPQAKTKKVSMKFH